MRSDHVFGARSQKKGKKNPPNCVLSHMRVVINEPRLLHFRCQFPKLKKFRAGLLRAPPTRLSAPAYSVAMATSNQRGATAAAGPRGSERRRWSTYGTMAARPPACASGARFNPAVSVESSQDGTGAGPGWVAFDPESAARTHFLPYFLGSAHALAANERGTLYGRRLAR